MISVAGAQVSHEPPPPLPGGYVVGEQVYFAGASQTVEIGYRLEHGKQGKVAGPATNEDAKGKGVAVSFPGNKSVIDCYLNQARRLPPLPGLRLAPRGLSCSSLVHHPTVVCGRTGEPRAATAAAGRLRGWRAGLLHRGEPGPRERRLGRARQAG